MVERIQGAFVNHFLYALIGAFILIFLNISSLHAQSCEPNKILPILHTYTQSIEYMNDQSVQDLGDFRHGGEGHGDLILGLAGGHVSAQIDMSFEFIPTDKNMFCIQISKMKADFYAAPEIHIASNFKKGSCEYNSVMEHERRHVKILNTAFKEFVPQFREKLWDVAREIPESAMLTMADGREHQSNILNYVTQNLQDYVQNLNAEIANRQQEIDTPLEYQRIKSECKNWGAKISGK